MQGRMTRPNAIGTFDFRTKQFLIASQIDFSVILETPSYFVYGTTEDCAESVASKERSHRCIYLSAAIDGNTRQVP